MRFVFFILFLAALSYLAYECLKFFFGWMFKKQRGKAEIWKEQKEREVEKELKELRKK